MADEAADDDLDVEIYEELSSFGKEFEELCKFRGPIMGWVNLNFVCSIL